MSKTPGSGLHVHSLSTDTSVLTCLANDERYDQVFSLQLTALERKGDALVVLSGSRNSLNIVKALVDVPIHLAIDDMQISEDAQTILGHMLM